MKGFKPFRTDQDHYTFVILWVFFLVKKEKESKRTQYNLSNTSIQDIKKSAEH